MKRNYILILAISALIGCTNSKNGRIKEKQAEEYYLKAMAILGNTTHNALSKSLSDEVLFYIDKAITLNPNESRYFRAKGAAYNLQQKYDLALFNLNHALQLDSTNSVAWMGRGIALENTSQFELAEQSYLKALQYDKTSSSLWINFGLLYSKWGKDSLSIKSYDQAIKIDPASTSAYINRGQVKLLNGLYEDAIADFNEAISRDSKDKISYNNRGLCQFYLKQYENAIDDFQKALSIKLGESFNENFDTDSYSYNNIANSYFAMGITEQACIYWKRAIQNGYKYKKEWKKEYNIDDPVELIKKYCK